MSRHEDILNVARRIFVLEAELSGLHKTLRKLIEPTRQRRPSRRESHPARTNNMTTYAAGERPYREEDSRYLYRSNGYTNAAMALEIGEVIPLIEGDRAVRRVWLNEEERKLCYEYNKGYKNA